MITSNLLYLFIAGCALFLIGLNVAFILELHRQLQTWFIIKLAAVAGLLVYTALSVLLGNPAYWRAGLGFAAIAADLVAFVWMWHNVQALQKKGVTGLIPLARYDADHGGMALSDHDG